MQTATPKKKIPSGKKIQEENFIPLLSLSQKIKTRSQPRNFFPSAKIKNPGGCRLFLIQNTKYKIQNSERSGLARPRSPEPGRPCPHPQARKRRGRLSLQVHHAHVGLSGMHQLRRRAKVYPQSGEPPRVEKYHEARTDQKNLPKKAAARIRDRGPRNTRGHGRGVHRLAAPRCTQGEKEVRPRARRTVRRSVGRSRPPQPRKVGNGTRGNRILLKGRKGHSGRGGSPNTKANAGRGQGRNQRVSGETQEPQRRRNGNHRPNRRMVRPSPEKLSFPPARHTANHTDQRTHTGPGPPGPGPTTATTTKSTHTSS